MIDKLDAITEYPTAKNKMTVHPEFHMLLALHYVLEIYPEQPVIVWVESHQDNDEQEKELKLDALLNIEADAFATEGLKSGVLKQKVLMDPNTYVQVHIDNTTITRYLKRAIWRVTKTEPLMRYYMNIFKWDDNACEKMIGRFSDGHTKLE